MSDQAISMIVGFGVVVGLRLLDWAFPKNMVWRRAKDWSTPAEDDKDTR
jgi:hypothetical protein